MECYAKVDVLDLPINGNCVFFFIIDNKILLNLCASLSHYFKMLANERPILTFSWRSKFCVLLQQGILTSVLACAINAGINV